MHTLLPMPPVLPGTVFHILRSSLAGVNRGTILRTCDLMFYQSLSDLVLFIQTAFVVNISFFYSCNY